MPPKTAKRKRSANVGSTPKQAKLTTFVAPVTLSNDSKQKENIPSDDNFLVNLLNEPSWHKALNAEMQKAYFKKLGEQLNAEYKKGAKVFPPRDKIFNVFNTTALENVKVVILGQDPYHDDGQGIPAPPSLKNIYKELTTDIEGFKAPSHGHLQSWAEQGVFLLNATLTVRAHQANSHASFGWQTFTDAVIKTISRECDGVVFILWGGFARKKAALIDKKKHTIIEAAHPSPLSVKKFLGCKCFSQTNAALKRMNKKEIDWRLPMEI